MHDSNVQIFTLGQDLRWVHLSREIRSSLMQNGQHPRLIEQMLADIKVRYDRLALPPVRSLHLAGSTPEDTEILAAQCRVIDDDAFDLAKSAIGEICRAVIDLYIERFESGCVMVSPSVGRGYRAGSETLRQ
jgi:hypothetical protein